MEVVSGIATELLHVAGFVPVVEFFLSPPNKLAYGLNHPVNKSQAQTLDKLDRCRHQPDIAGEVGVYARSLHFYRYLAPAEIAHVHLADRGGGERLHFERIKDFRRGLFPFLNESFVELCITEKGAKIEQV